MFSILRSITRITVGGIVTGYDLITKKIYEWDSEIESDTQVESISSKENETTADLLRYAVIGMLVETEERIYRRSQSAMKAFGRFSKLTDPFIRSVPNSRILSPFRNNFLALMERGEDEVQRWVDIGRVEEHKGQQLAEEAFYETIDFWVHYFAEDPEVVGLVTSQSVSFAQEVVEEIRERTVSADNYIEGLVRYFLRRTPRQELPDPPQHIKAQAIYNRQSRNRMLMP